MTATLVFPRDSSWTTPGQTGDTLSIPLIVTTYATRNTKPKVNVVTSLPMMEIYSQTSWGGTAVASGPRELAKVTVEGTIDTPTVAVDQWVLPNLLDQNGHRYTYAELIQACFEGRYSEAFGWWRKVEPLSFTDPYGRVFEHVRLFDFQAGLVEAIPGRNTFSMVLVVR